MQRCNPSALLWALYACGQSFGCPFCFFNRECPKAVNLGVWGSAPSAKHEFSYQTLHYLVLSVFLIIILPDTWIIVTSPRIIAMVSHIKSVMRC